MIARSPYCLSSRKNERRRGGVKTEVERDNRSLLVKKELSHEKMKSILEVKTPQSYLEQSKIIPKNIIYDKETLYYEVRELKIALNKVMDENVKLKTRIAFQQNEQQKINRSSEVKHQRYYKERKEYEQQRREEDRRIKGKTLKIELEELHQENEGLQRQLKQVKSMVRYTQIHQLQIQNKILLGENAQISQKNAELNKRIQSYEQLTGSTKGLQRSLLELSIQNQKYRNKIQDLHLQIMNLQSEQKKQRQQYINREKRLLRLMSEQKNRSPKKNNYFEQVRQELQNDKIACFRSGKAEQKLRQTSFKAHHIHVQPIRRQHIDTNNMIPKHSSSPNKTFFDEVNSEPQNATERKKLKQAKSIFNKIDDKLLVNEQEKMQKISCFTQTDEIEVQRKVSEKQIILIKESQEKTEKQKQGNKQLKTQRHKNEQIDEKNYQITDKQKKSQIISSTEKIRSNQSQIKEKMHQSLRNFQGNAKIGIEAEREEDFKATFTNRKAASHEESSFEGQSLSEVKIMLTYRMKYQKYPFSHLKKDIEASTAKNFSYIDLCYMLVNEPFYMSVKYSKTVLQFMFDQHIPKQDSSISSSQLILKLRGIIQEFKPLSADQEIKMIQKCADSLKAKEQQLRQQLTAASNAQGLISLQNFTVIFSKNGFQQSQIEIFLCQISIQSEDLQHLNYNVLFDRFLSEQNLPVQKRDIIFQQTEEENSFLAKSNLKASRQRTQQILQQKKQSSNIINIHQQNVSPEKNHEFYHKEKDIDKSLTQK